MSFRKYREYAQWGKINTRIIKEIYRARLKKQTSGYPKKEFVQLPGTMVLKSSDVRLPPKKVKVYAADELLAELDGRPRSEDLPKFEHPAFTPPKIEVALNFSARIYILFRIIPSTSQIQFTFMTEQSRFLMAWTKFVTSLAPHQHSRYPNLFIILLTR